MWQKAKNQYHFLIALLANIIYRFPGRSLKIIGVTGTDGKTTTVNLIYHVLQTAGKHVSMISTIGAQINGIASPLGFHVTTPSSFQIQRFFKQALRGAYGEQFVVLEVSSHAIDQNRIWGIPFAVGVVTNITNEHLDYHKTYDNYLKTKAKLLKRASIAILNADDNSYAKLLLLLHKKQYITYGIKNNANITQKEFPKSSHLIGQFNSYNVLAAAAACKAVGIHDTFIKKGIKSFQTPIGRMNAIENKLGLQIIVDYAHTPNGLDQALTALLETKKDKVRIIALVGAEGKRDPGKREKIGAIAARLADIVIITAVDPRGENERIQKAIVAGAEKSGGKLNTTIFIEPDRAKAIKMAIKQIARKGDIIGLFGKGHERSMNYDGKKEVSWSDIEEVKKVLAL